MQGLRAQCLCHGYGNETHPVFLPGNPMDRGVWQAIYSPWDRKRHDLGTKSPPPPLC